MALAPSAGAPLASARRFDRRTYRHAHMQALCNRNSFATILIYGIGAFGGRASSVGQAL